MQRNIYLKTLPLAEAINIAKTALNRDYLVKIEMIPTTEAAGRILAEPAIAKFSSPTFHSAAMDGVAVHSKDTFSAREGAPVRLLPEKDFIYINTGNVMPAEFDAVVMIEDVAPDEDGSIEIETPVPPWRHVRRIGEDIVATELVLPRYRKLSPYDVAAMLSCGIYDVAVYERIKVHIIPTGDEVLDSTLRLEPKIGQVVDSNRSMLSALAEEVGCLVSSQAPVSDDPELLGQVFEEALQSAAHIVIIIAGSSAGSKDFTRAVIESKGIVLLHGVAAMPGKPSLVGIAVGKLIIGAPGYPVSSAICFREIVEPLIAWLSRMEEPRRDTLEVTLGRDVPSKLGLDEFIRLTVGRVGENWMALPLAKGAGLITSMTKAQALTVIPANSEGVKSGTKVQASLLVDRRELEKTLVCVGSHDNTLDLLSDFLMVGETPIFLASTHVGSMGGLTAIRSGSAMLAGAHLLDEETGDFNFSFLKKYLPDVDVTVINLAIRHQGFIVAKGNPKNISGVKDLTREDIRFVNRQRGAGTRILLDYQLKKEGISPEQIRGYDWEESTHMSVAINVKTGAADCGLGVYSAAAALELGFVSMAKERYDLIIPTKYMEDKRILALLKVIRTDEFKIAVEKLGGYETYLTGKLMIPGLGLGEQS